MKLNALFLLSLLVFSLTVTAAHRSTQEEAKAMFDMAVTAYETDGKAAALNEFNQKKGKFTKGDLYVFAIDEAGNYLASGANPALVGTPLKGTVDAAGHSIYDMIVESLSSNKDPATVDYVWLNRQTNQVESKTSYVKKIDDAIIGVGYYH